ncbi:MAG: nif-specific transcriptional activator NifA [Deltaproteobacteria bacterium]|nr:nif-specific transcriptional activator NifA [Deltaproteobacteria bacterium]
MPTSVHRLKLTALVAVCQVIDRALDLEESLSDVLRILSGQLAMQRAAVTLYDPATGLLNICASHGLSPEEKRRGVYRLGEGVTGRIFETGKPYYVPDVSREPLFLDRTGARRVRKDRISFLGVPILVNGEPIGVLHVDRLFLDDVDVAEDMEFLSVVATLVAQFISLNEKVRRREEHLRAENVQLRSQLVRGGKGPFLVGRSQSMQEVQRQMERVASTKATVLLLGESGVGKTLIARTIHEISDRKTRPFVKVNCASIPENLLESELFGYERGAFTGASGTRAGRFEDADGGTIFLDEIGDLPLSVQAKFLRVLQEREFERLGSNRTRTVDVRVIAATNRDLHNLSGRSEFRADLYYRLSVFPITVPPLRERREDVPGLLNYFLNKAAQDYARTLSLTPEALQSLVNHHWPGNVREMENLVERLAIMAEQERIDGGAIDALLKRSRDVEAGSVVPETRSRAGTTLAEVERAEVLAALDRAGWIQSRAATLLGITPRQMGYRVRKFGLARPLSPGKTASKGA